MALFKTVDEIKDFIPVAASFNFKDILPFIKKAETEFIIPAIGQVTYDALHAAYAVEVPALSSDETALLEKIRVPLAAFAYFYWIPFGQVKISGAGIQINNTDSAKTAFEWQIDRLDRSASMAGYQGIDDLLTFLELNKATYTDWAASSAYTVFKECFINTADEFSEAGVNINGSRRAFLTMKPEMKKVEEFDIRRVLTNDLFNEIKTQIKDNSLTAANTAALVYIRGAVAHMTYYRALLQMSVIVDERGVNVFSNNNAATINVLEPADSMRIHEIRKAAYADAETYLKLLTELIVGNPTDYPAYAAVTYTQASEPQITNSTDNTYIALM